MAEQTLISWTDRTQNFWWGCERVSPGCDHCFAAALDRRTGGKHWDHGVLPRLTAMPNRRRPHTWNRVAEQLGVRHRVFCGSMMDWADRRVPSEWRAELWNTIRDTPWLDWQLLTKRAPKIRASLPEDWGSAYPNAWLGVTVENRKHGLPRIEHLRRIPAQVRFLSAEPLLEDLGDVDLSEIHWVIVGGESGASARSMDDVAAARLIRQCREQGVAVWFKQNGGRGKDKGGSLFRGEVIQEWPTTPYSAAVTQGQRLLELVARGAIAPDDPRLPQAA